MVTPAVIIAYYAAWSIYSRAYLVQDIPGDKITHINYAFANIGSDGRIALGDAWADTEKSFPGDIWDQPLRGNFKQLIKLKEKYTHLRTLISVGGWTWSGKFSDIAVSTESRHKFAKSCVEFIQKYSFDGVDIDWEYPVSGGLPANIHRPEDKENYVLLLEELRKQLDAAGETDQKTYLLTVATGAGTERIADMDIPGMATHLDWINVMTYDFHGGWEAKTGHNAPLFTNDAETTTDDSPSFIKSKYNCNAAIQAYIEAEAPRSKLVMGLGSYGRGWQGVTSTEMNGYSQSASAQLPTGTWENGVFDYTHLKKSYMPTYKRHWDSKSKVPFLYNPSTGIWISYDDVQSIGIKSDYIKREKLAGAMFWELSCDRSYELIDAARKVLHNGIAPTSEPDPPIEESPKEGIDEGDPPLKTKTTTADPTVEASSKEDTDEGNPPPKTKTTTTDPTIEESPKEGTDEGDPPPETKTTTADPTVEESSKEDTDEGHPTPKTKTTTADPTIEESPKEGTDEGDPPPKTKTTTADPTIEVSSKEDTDEGHPTPKTKTTTADPTIEESPKEGTDEGDPPPETKTTTADPTIEESPKEGTNHDDPLWKTGTEYKVDDRVMYENELYQCLQAHTSLPDWTPLVIAALWKRV